MCDVNVEGFDECIILMYSVIIVVVVIIIIKWRKATI